MEQIQPYLDYFAANPEWAVVITFLIAFGEALLIIGLFVPSTVVLVGAGMLVGSGHLEFWPVFIATAVGAIAGDQVSYWAGRFFGVHLKEMWPLSRYPQLLARGEDYVRQHGGKSIAVGRFVPGVKAVVPGIVGMLGMNQLYFTSVNLVSGLFWTATHIFPGILLGQGLSLAGELSERLLIVLVVLIGGLAIAGWLIRLAAAGVSPYVDKILIALSDWARSKKSKPFRRLGLALRPGRPRAKLLLLFGIICIAGFIMLIDMVSGLVLRHALSNVDLSVNNLLSELRSAPGDDLMVTITMMGDGLIIYGLGLVLVSWLIWHRAWRAAIATLVTIAFSRLVVWCLKIAIERPRPPMASEFSAGDYFSFPSGHTVMAGTVLGIVAVLASHAMGRWSKAVVVASCSVGALAIAFSRLYLGVHWTSDVIGGLVLALVVVTAFGIVIEAVPARRIRPAGLLLASVFALAGLGTFHVSMGFDNQLKRYAKVDKVRVFADTQWTDDGWQSLSPRRIDFSSKNEEIFVVQWIGKLDTLQALAKNKGWTLYPKWTWRDGLTYLNDSSALKDTAPRPLLHEGLKAKMTAVLPAQDGAEASNSRLVVRVFQSNALIQVQQNQEPVYLISLTREHLKRRSHLYAIPEVEMTNDEVVAPLIRTMSEAGVGQLLAQHDVAGSKVAIIQSKPLSN